MPHVSYLIGGLEIIGFKTPYSIVFEHQTSRQTGTLARLNYIRYLQLVLGRQKTPDGVC